MSFPRSTPGSTSLGPAYTSSLAATGQALEFLAAADAAAFVAAVKGVPQALLDSVNDMMSSSSKRAPCVVHHCTSERHVSPKFLQLLHCASAAGYALNYFFICPLVGFSSQPRSCCRHLSHDRFLALISFCIINFIIWPSIKFIYNRKLFWSRLPVDTCKACISLNALCL
jgi:hypothetical protein